MILNTSFSICKSDFSAFAYLDMGYVKFDAKVPRRSGTFHSIEEARNFLAKYKEFFKKTCEFNIKEVNSYIDFYLTKSGTDAADKLQRYYDLKARYEDEIKTIDFKIVKLTVEPVE